MKTITIDKLTSYLNQRVPIADFIGINRNSLSVDLSPVYSAQPEIVRYLSSGIADLNPYYVKIFLKHLISLLEQHCEDGVQDELYEIYCSPEIMNATESKPTDTDVIKYYVGGFAEGKVIVEENRAYVTIRESPRLLSGSNTTGLRTWEAALFLSNYLNGGLVDFHNATICELGGGTGLVSLSLSKCYSNVVNPIKEIIITDGADLLLDKLGDTIFMNKLQNKPVLRCQKLLWGTTNEFDAQGVPNEDFIQSPPSNVDYVIAADVTYDSRIVDSLASTINDFFIHSGTRAAFVAATIRNEDSNLVWEQTLELWFPGRWLIRDTCASPENLDTYCWFRVGTPEIRVYEICK